MTRKDRRFSDIVPGNRQLTPREVEVYRCLLLGARNEEMSRNLGISIHTVRRHVSSVLSKQHQPNRYMLVVAALARDREAAKACLLDGTSPRAY